MHHIRPVVQINLSTHARTNAARSMNATILAHKNPRNRKILPRLFCPFYWQRVWVVFTTFKYYLNWTWFFALDSEPVFLGQHVLDSTKHVPESFNQALSMLDIQDMSKITIYISLYLEYWSEIAPLQKVICIFFSRNCLFFILLLQGVCLKKIAQREEARGKN